MPARPLLGVFEIALSVSLVAHLLFLVGWWALSGTPAGDGDTVALTQVRRIEVEGRLEGYRERRVVQPRAVAARPPAPAQPPGVSLVRAPRPEPRPEPVRVVNRVRPTPPVARATPAPAETPVAAQPSPLAAQPHPEPPPDEPSPEPSSLAAQPSPEPSPAEPSPEPSPAAAASPSPAPVVTPPRPDEVLVVQDPAADFAVLLEYHNDDRIPRDGRGFLILDVAQISALEDVKPVLAEVPKGSIPLKQAGDYGLNVMDRVHASVALALEVPGGLPALVPPAAVRVEDVSVDGRPLDDASRERIAQFIQQQVQTSQWFPASSRGVMQEHSEQRFTVQLIQTRDNRVAGRNPRTSRE